MADIFVSYTSRDRAWAEWIGLELEKLGHVAHLDAWEISAGDNIAAWMEKRHHEADHIICVTSDRYLEGAFSAQERHGALWAAASKRPNFLVPVFIEPCETPTLLAPYRSCELFGLNESEARAKLKDFMKPAGKPTAPVPFPGAGVASGGAPLPQAPVAFPGRADFRPKNAGTISNIPINVPRHFFGRDDDLAAIEKALGSNNDRAAITALHGLRGVGKTMLAAAFAEKHRNNYRATWWIRAETESTMRADLVGLGIQLGWVAVDSPEEPAVKAVLQQLRRDGEGLLLIYDNATTPNELSKFLPRGIGPHIIVTSNAPNWRGVAALVGIEVWPNDTGADFLVARTGRASEREAATTLAEALGGLPLAHEQAAAYCERTGVAFAEYNKRFAKAPAPLLDGQDDASPEYHGGLTVAKTFALAIDEAAKLHPAAERLIVYAALLAPEPIPLFLFSEAREKFEEPFASNLVNDGLDEAVAALRAFALLDREAIPDEREPSFTTDCIRMHRVVRQVAATRRSGSAVDNSMNVLIEALAQIFPTNASNPNAWPRIRRLDALAYPLVTGKGSPSDGIAEATSYLLDILAAYRQVALSAFDDARELYERALHICETSLGLNHPNTGATINNLAGLVRTQGDVEAARKLYEQSLAISEEMFGADHQNTATCLNNLASVLYDEGDLYGAQRLFERALLIVERENGPDSPETAGSLNNLALVLKTKGDLLGAKPLYERALAIYEEKVGPDDPETAAGLSNLGNLLKAQGDFVNAQLLFERALAIDTKILGPDHPETATDLANLAILEYWQGDFDASVLLLRRALRIRESVFGVEHSKTRDIVDLITRALSKLGRTQEITALIEKYRGSR